MHVRHTVVGHGRALLANELKPRQPGAAGLLPGALLRAPKLHEEQLLAYPQVVRHSAPQQNDDAAADDLPVVENTQAEGPAHPAHQEGHYRENGERHYGLAVGARPREVECHSLPEILPHQRQGLHELKQLASRSPVCAQHLDPSWVVHGVELGHEAQLQSCLDVDGVGELALDYQDAHATAREGVLPPLVVVRLVDALCSLGVACL
mmetsp:Transcript_63813/g.172182  ORF Transcript_63813/g.172182 Transcript_63813/m.172182 type:complete len:207 (-) Transcript_63813:663-1283(-)